MKEVLVCPSILSANLSNLAGEACSLKEAGAYGLHVDIMDGHFVNNISFGVPVVESLKGFGLFLDIHLMVTNPLNLLESFVKAGANMITLHVECLDDLKKCVFKIKSLGCGVGLAVKPFTAVCAVEEFLCNDEFSNLIDLILVMTVEPGFAGQIFMKNMLFKIGEVRKLNPFVHIAVDGGVNFKTARLAVEAGADWLVAGSYVFNSRNYKKSIENLKFGFDSCNG